MTLSYKDVAEIVKIIDSSNCDEVSLDIEGAKILIRRKGAVDPAPANAADITPSTTGVAPTPTAAAPIAAQAAPPAQPSDASHVCAPMVGTFYGRPSPDEPEFVSVGMQVDIGTPLCIIEVMKLFTTIESTKAGTIKAILADDGQLVDYGQALFVIE